MVKGSSSSRCAPLAATGGESLQTIGKAFESKKKIQARVSFQLRFWWGARLGSQW